MSEALRRYRDDGPLADLLGRIIPGSRVGPVVLLPASLLVGTALLLVRDGTTSVTGVVALFVIVGGASVARPLTGRADWLVPTLLRLTEYGALVAMAALWHPEALAAVYATLFAVSTHQYETVYRLRHLGVAPPRWVSWVALGWEGRLLGGAFLLGAGAPPLIWTTFAAVTFTLFIAESAAAWARASRAAVAR